MFDAARREASVRRKTQGSLARHERACRSLAGGVSSGFRRLARPHPLYFEHGCGARVADVDGNRYLDYGLAWGPLILGHAPPEVADAVAAQARRGMTFGAQHDLEIEVAEKLARAIPCAELATFASSGTEIVQVALRLARGATGRRKLLKFEGHYHGWDDSVLLSHHPTRAEIDAAAGAPVAVGLGQRPASDVAVVEWNDAAAVERVFDSHGHELAAVICEPLLCNSGSIPPEPGFLELLRHRTRERGVVLIFDEVITGFRLALGGAQELYGVTPDLATYAKAVGAGVPLAVLAGRREIMDRIAAGSVVHSGSLNGNPLCLAAANAALDRFARDPKEFYGELWRKGERLREGLESLLRRRGHAVVTSGGGPVFSLFFMNSEPPRRYRDTLSADAAALGDFCLALLDEGILVLPDGRWYLSAAHSDEDVDETLAAAERAVSGI
jgi:glutamate-1-semialdehyde 2,1-aminomutase